MPETWCTIINSAERVNDMGVIGRNVYNAGGFMISGFGSTLKQQRANAEAWWNQRVREADQMRAMIP